MWAIFNRFDIQMTKAQAQSASHPGPCDADVEELIKVPEIRRQLAKLEPAKLAEELKEYGAWDDEELADNEQNKRRIIWIAAGNIAEGN